MQEHVQESSVIGGNANACETVTWPPSRYASRTQGIYSLCKAWFDGVIGLQEFYSDEAEIHGVDKLSSVECDGGEDIFSMVEAHDLTREFDFVASIANAVLWANANMQDEGFGDDAPAIVRAIYFAREWAEFSEGFDGMPPLPVYSRQ